jgi:hypothetical protein
LHPYVLISATGTGRKQRTRKMMDKRSNEFMNLDGSINTTKAIQAGHEERSEAIREMFGAAYGRLSGIFRLKPEQINKNMPLPR